jgi:autotransporter-associated beta strand protein
MRVFGNNVTVANLSSINSGQITLVEGPRVRNMNTTNAGTLTVGTDGTSTEFDGTFSDGAAAPLGLTKVGAGTLTLTSVNTNTGTVKVSGGKIAMTGSGSFAKAANIIAGSGATFDVSGAGGSLALNSGQTLSGSGTVNGTVTTLAGSTINPGDAVGTLNVSGAVTLGGRLLLELNNTNTPSTFDRLNATGGITYGGTLLVTNVGPALHVGDTFQLFSSGIGAFTGITLATNDANRMNYTWENDVATLGSVKVLSVVAQINSAPTNIVVASTNGTLTLSWPVDHTGWHLQSNSVSLGSTNFWFDVANSTATNQVNLGVDPSKTNVFFRLTLPLN